VAGHAGGEVAREKERSARDVLGCREALERRGEPFLGKSLVDRPATGLFSSSEPRDVGIGRD
jgi:hypothetical protein